ncbi:MAG: protease family protein [Thermosediminibacterales bacterium]|jgi:hypothetical protein|nr:protease family protein [Thermosediminibacterales bacterium]
MRNIKKIIWVIFLSFILLLVPKIAGLFASLFDYSTIDPNGSYAWISVHHLFQAFVFLFVMILCKRTYQVDFGFHWGDKKIGKAITLRFILFFTLYTIGLYTHSSSVQMVFRFFIFH